MLPKGLLAAKAAYEKNGFICSELVKEAESAEYAAYTFKLNNHSILFRAAKITPTKIGQFVTLWKRKAAGPIQPYDECDKIDYFIISCQKDNHLGQFVFPKSVLIAQKVLSKRGKGGKRAIRVYPPWDIPTSSQAQKTQSWQLAYFIKISHNGMVDKSLLQKIFC